MAETEKKITPEMRYLLGTLPDDERTRIEEAFFADDAKFEQLEFAEDELVDAYVNGELSNQDRQQFERRLRGSPRLLERVYFADVLAERISRPLLQDQTTAIPLGPLVSEPAKETVGWWQRLFAQQPEFRIAFAAPLILLLVGSLALFAGWLRLRSESQRFNSERAALQQQKEELEKLSNEQRKRTEQLAAELQRERDQRAEDRKLIEELQRQTNLGESTNRQSFLSTIATVFLTPGTLRSGSGSSQLTLGPITTTARLQLALERNDYLRYQATIKTADGAVVFSQRGLKPRKIGSGAQLTLSVPSRRLTPGDYTVQVDGITPSGQVESVSDYAFRVLSQKK